MGRLRSNPAFFLFVIAATIPASGCMGFTPGSTEQPNSETPKSDSSPSTSADMGGDTNITPDPTPADAPPVAPAIFAEQTIQATVTAAVAAEPAYRIDAAEIAALTEHGDSLTPEELALIRSVAGQ